MLMIKTLTNQAVVHQAVKMDHHPQKLLSISGRTIEKGHGLVVRQDGIIVGRPIGETVMEGDQDPVVGIETDVGGQDQAVKSGIDDRQDLVVQTEEVVTIPLHDSTEDHHPQGTG